MNMKEEIDKLVIKCYEEKFAPEHEGVPYFKHCAGCSLGVECGKMQNRKPREIDFTGFEREAMIIRAKRDFGGQHDHLEVCMDGKVLCYLHVDHNDIDVCSGTKRASIKGSHIKLEDCE